MNVADLDRIGVSMGQMLDEAATSARTARSLASAIHEVADVGVPAGSTFAKTVEASIVRDHGPVSNGLRNLLWEHDPQFALDFSTGSAFGKVAFVTDLADPSVGKALEPALTQLRGLAQITHADMNPGAARYDESIAAIDEGIALLRG